MGSWASGVTDAEGSDRGEYLPVGTFDVEVVYTTSFEKRNGGGVLCKVRVRLLASNAPSAKVNDERDMCFNVDPSRKDVVKLQLADVRGFIMAAEGAKQEEVTEETTYYIFPTKTESKVCAGKKIRIVATDIGAEGKPFTKYVCRPFNEKLHAQLKAA